MLGVVIGLWVDSKLGTSLFWIVGVIFGLVVAFYGVYQMLIPFTHNKQDKEDS
ncbi:AtpZ/AtpI family protein [Chloroflexota bacterium]